MSDSGGLIRRGNFSENFLAISRFTAEDNSLTFEARGLLFEILAKPPTWKIVIKDLIKRSPAGKHKVYRILRELIDRRYIWRVQFRDHQGRWQRPIYYVYGEPQHEIPRELVGMCTVNTDSISPQTKNQNAVKGGRNNPHSSFRQPVHLKPDYRDTENQPLVNKQFSKYASNKTTTDIDFNEWPPSFAQEEINQILKIAQGVDKGVVEKLLIELVDRSDAVKNPISYFHELVRRSKGGAFVPTKKVQRKKSQLLDRTVKERQKEVKEISEQRRLKMIGDHLKSS